MTRHVLFLLGSARRNGNSEGLARLAAQSLSADTAQTWLHLRDYPLPPFEDLRHTEQGYAAPKGHAQALLQATQAASDIVFVTPVYWYAVSTDLKRYLDEWSAWLRSVPDFKAQMAGKRYWVITANTGTPQQVQPMFDTLALCVGFCGAALSGTLLGNGSKPGEALTDEATLQAARALFAE